MLATGSGHLGAFPPEQRRAQMMFFLDLHAHGVYVAQVFWCGLLPLGYLVFKSGPSVGLAGPEPAAENH